MPTVGAGDPDGEFKGCLTLSQKGQFEEAVQCLEMFKARYPDTLLGQEAELRIGDAYFQKKEYLLAAESYEAFLLLHPRSPKADYAHYRKGVAYYKEAPKAIDRDQENLETAIKELEIVLNYYPNSAYRELAGLTHQVARKRMARRSFYIGKFYYQTGEYIAAIPRFWDVVEKYPDVGLTEKALFKIVISTLKVGKMEEAREAFGKLSTDYPNSKYTRTAERKMLSAAKKFK